MGYRSALTVDVGSASICAIASTCTGFPLGRFCGQARRRGGGGAMSTRPNPFAACSYAVADPSRPGSL
jgi:hypothetical protein